jgi:hypothetical protein
MALLVLKTAALSLGLNYGAHYASARLYDMYCVPHSFESVIQSLVTTASPACSFLLNTMTVTQQNYAVVLTTTVASVLTSALKTGAAA